MSKLYLLSTSPIKIGAVKSLDLVKSSDLIYVDVTDNAHMPPQPVGYDGGLQCAIRRTKLFKQSLPSNFDPFHDVIMSIENFIVPDEKRDVCCVYIELNGKGLHSYSDNIYNPIYPEEYAVEMGEIVDYNDGITGYRKTMGQIIHDHNNAIPSNDWAANYGGTNRHDQIISSYANFNRIEFLKNFIRYVPDHPEPGVLFTDLMPLTANIVLKNMLYDVMIDKIKQTIGNIKIDYIVGLDARGFIFGEAISEKLNIAFVAMRKKGKLGGSDCYYEEYGKEYGKGDALEIVKTTMRPNSNVLIVDDVLATGGTLNAAKNLCNKFNSPGEYESGKVKIYGLVVSDIDKLREKAKEKLKEFYPNIMVCF